MRTRLPNKYEFKEIAGSICAPRGFAAAAVFCDIKRLGTGQGSEKGKKRDLALIVSEVPAAVAGVFTRNKVCAAPVKWSARCAAGLCAQAIVVNSGNANACTGRQGMRDAAVMAQLTAKAVAGVHERRHRIRPQDVLVASTGRIGVPLPMKNVARGIRDCAPRLARSAANARAVAEAIMTSDTRRKEIAVEFACGDTTVRIGGICKGAGMIQPGMRQLHATMLGFLTTDAAIESRFLQRALQEAVDHSFNRITVDGDMSTNDSVMVLANRRAGNRPINARSPARKSFQAALNHVCLELAKMIVRDGEGVTRFVTVRVRGARHAADAERAARAVCNSSLVRTSWFGGDPNWGRILCAVGYSGAQMNEAVTEIGYRADGTGRILYGFRRGRPAETSFRQLCRITAAASFEVEINLRLGEGEFVMYASDLTEEYVQFNKGDVSDPNSLGG